VTGVVLFNMGGPERLEDIQPFLVNLFSDRDIIELPLGRLIQPFFARALTRARLAAVRRNYEAIGGGSPQLRLTWDQAAALERSLNTGGSVHAPFHVTVAMRYTPPFAADALVDLAARDIRRIVTVPLYPHWSQATTGSSRSDFERALAGYGSAFEVTHISSYAEDHLYLDALADTIRQTFDAMPAASRARAVILFSAHGLPQRLVDRGDPYVWQIEATRRGLVDRLALPNRHVLAYQSRTGPVKWIGPGTEEVIQELGAEGVKDLLVVPLSFVSEHIETLYEVDLLFAEAARRSGIVEYHRPAALNTHPLFMEALGRLVVRHLDTLLALARHGDVWGTAA
jgi:protoporphyrin/coproporphyrin ferrochelatase